MHLLIVSATFHEVEPLYRWLLLHGSREGSAAGWRVGRVQAELLVTGVGMLATAHKLSQRLSATPKPDLVLNLGVAGSYRQDWPLGRVVQVRSEQLADFGVEEADGRFVSAFEMGLCDPDQAPFSGGRLWHPHANSLSLDEAADGLTVQRVHGELRQIALARERYQADIETMEGAAFFYVCLEEGASFFAFRAISNYVEPRNRSNWKLETAIEALNTYAVSLLKSFE